MRTRISISLLILISLAMIGNGLAVAVPNSVRTVTVDRGAARPSISPDGSQIAVSIFGKIWLVPIAGGEARQLTGGLGWETQPAWSPDGRFLAYAHQLPSGTDLVLLNLNTSGKSIIYHTDSTLGQITFHPGSAEIFFLLDRSQYDSHIWRIPVTGGEAKQITFTENWHEWSFALSPDGRHIFFDSGRYGGSDLYAMELENTRSRRLTNTLAHESNVAWSRDGKTHIFIETDNGIDTVVVQPASGGEGRRIYSSPYDQKQIALHPDGASAVLCAARRLYRLNLSNGQITPIAFTARFTLMEQAKADLVITNARLFDGTGRDVIPNATIEIRNGRIAAIRAGQEARALPAGVPVIDAGGKMALPGLMDNHYHYWSPFAGSTLIARGITSVRDPGVSISDSMNFKETITLGMMTGPDIYTCGPLIDGLGGYHPKVDVALSKPDAAAQLVRSLKSQGVDALKVYFLLNPEVLSAVIKEARAQGLPVTGHIGVRTGWREAMNAGINGFSHVRVWKDFLPREKQPQGENETLDSTKNPIARMQADWSDIDPDGAAAEALIKMMIEKKVAIDPTLTIQRIGEGHRRRFGPEQFALAQETFKRMSRFVERAQKMGVMLLAGTDNVNLHDEMETYAEAGIPNVEILKAATANGAEWLGKKSEFGTIEAGKRADIILVDGDPLANIKEIRKISVVIKDGRVAFKK